LLSASAFSSPADTLVKPDSKEYLKMNGIVKESREKDEGFESTRLIDSAEISVYTHDNVLLATFITNKKGKCEFKLPLNKKFIIRVTKKGYVTKFIEVNSKVPHDKKKEYVFPFQVDIFEEIKGLDVSVLNNPVAKITYSTFEERFVYDVNYTNKINADLKKMYKDYYFLQQMEEDSLSGNKATEKDKRDKKKKN
jgi:hypothetical protein